MTAKWDYVLMFPIGMEELFNDELSSLCGPEDDTEVLWTISGAARISTRAEPKKLMTLRSIDYLCAYLHHSTVDPQTFNLDNINDCIDPRKDPKFLGTWTRAFELWQMNNSGFRLPKALVDVRKYDQLNTTDTEKILFRVTGRRRGIKGTVGSMDGAARLGEIAFECFDNLYGSMKKYQMEVFYDMNLDQQTNEHRIIFGISLTPDRVSIRNRIKCGPTTLDAANAYALIKWCNIQPGEVVLDPMAGAGTIPIEGSHLHPDAHFIVSDLTMSNIDTASANVNACHGKGPLSVFCADVTRMPVRSQSVDVVVSDLPFGMRHGSINANKALYPALFKLMERILRPGGRAVLLTLAKSVIKGVIDSRRRYGWTLVRERMLEVGGYLSWVFELTFTLKPDVSSYTRELHHILTGEPRKISDTPRSAEPHPPHPRKGPKQRLPSSAPSDTSRDSASSSDTSILPNTTQSKKSKRRGAKQPKNDSAPLTETKRESLS